ncbi:hypothetical protein EDD16DRAFT_1578070 [Pisolithus croceorrhizus]|nr:hypothetical protein EV401DRAFT_1970193 [Pisolithus croceorrhizus]KAI6120149.1 hypothetical protein EDD16DRAFT_1578070 [Pisolithus croceorrhizus]
MDDEVAACRDLPESRSEALEPTDDMSKLAGGCPTENDPLLSDPPSTHAELPTLQIKCSILQNEARAQSATNSEIDLSCTRRSDKLREMKHLELDSERASRCPQRTHRGHSTCETPPDEVWGMGVHTPARAGLGDSTDVRLTATRHIGIRLERSLIRLRVPVVGVMTWLARTSLTHAESRKRC